MTQPVWSQDYHHPKKATLHHPATLLFSHYYCLLKKSINTCADCLPASTINSSNVGPASPFALSEIARTTANGTSIKRCTFCKLMCLTTIITRYDTTCMVAGLYSSKKEQRCIILQRCSLTIITAC